MCIVVFVGCDRLPWNIALKVEPFFRVALVNTGKCSWLRRVSMPRFYFQYFLTSKDFSTYHIQEHSLTEQQAGSCSGVEAPWCLQSSDGTCHKSFIDCTASICFDFVFEWRAHLGRKHCCEPESSLFAYQWCVLLVGSRIVAFVVFVALRLREHMHGVFKTYWSCSMLTIKHMHYGPIYGMFARYSFRRRNLFHSNPTNYLILVGVFNRN